MLMQVSGSQEGLVGRHLPIPSHPQDAGTPDPSSPYIPSPALHPEPCAPRSKPRAFPGMPDLADISAMSHH